MTFKDHFSERAESYAAFRPAYPHAFVEAIALATRFDHVIATDASHNQLEHAVTASNVEYRRAPAEASGLSDGSVDLVTAAQSLHWFDIEAFFRETRRILAPGGAVAAWGYGDPVLDDPALHATIHELNRGILEQYWPAERSVLLAGYRAIDFPFDEEMMPGIVLEARWTLSQLLGLLRTWSAVSRYMAEHKRDPVSAIEPALARAWGPPEKQHLIRWPLYVRAGGIGMRTAGC